MSATSNPPPLDENARAQILLALTPDVGPILRGRLLERFETAACVFAASEADLQSVQGIGPNRLAVSGASSCGPWSGR